MLGGRKVGGYGKQGGLATIQSNSRPATGRYRSPSCTSTIPCKPFNRALSLASRHARGLNSTAVTEWLQRAACIASSPVPAHKSRQWPCLTLGVKRVSSATESSPRYRLGFAWGGWQTNHNPRIGRTTTPPVWTDPPAVMASNPPSDRLARRRLRSPGRLLRSTSRFNTKRSTSHPVRRSQLRDRLAT